MMHYDPGTRKPRPVHIMMHYDPGKTEPGPFCFTTPTRPMTIRPSQRCTSTCSQPASLHASGTGHGPHGCTSIPVSVDCALNHGRQRQRFINLMFSGNHIHQKKLHPKGTEYAPHKHAMDAGRHDTSPSTLLKELLLRPHHRAQESMNHYEQGLYVAVRTLKSNKNGLKSLVLSFSSSTASPKHGGTRAVGPTWMMGTTPKSVQIAKSMRRKAVATTTGCAMHAALSSLRTVGCG
eukprot:scaffold42916_cov23-Tisochrysis_lutea.AAC.1